MSKLGGNPLWERLSNLIKKWFYSRQLLSSGLRSTRRATRTRYWRWWHRSTHTVARRVAILGNRGGGWTAGDQRSTLHRHRHGSPPRPDHHHVVVRTSSDALCERRHDRLVSGLAHLQQQSEAAFTTFGTDESRATKRPHGRCSGQEDVKPFVVRLYRTDQRLSSRCLDAAQDRLQADPAFIHRPEGNSGVEQLRLAELLH